MNYLQHIYNRADAGSIFDAVEEKLKCNLPCRILLPLEQKRFISLDSNDKIEVEVGWLTRHKKFGSCIIKPHEIENPLVVYRFSAKENLRLTDDEWQDVKKVFCALSKYMPEVRVYSFVGNLPEHSCYIFGTYRVTATSYQPISNTLIRGRFDIEQASADFFFEKYVPCFRSQTEGLIVLFTLLLSLNLSRIAAIYDERPSWVQLLYTLAQKFPAKYTDLWLKFVANNVFLFRDGNIAHSLHSYLYHQTRQSGLMGDEDVVKLWRFLVYLIGQGVAEYYPYMRHITARHGEVTTYTDSDLKTISHYSAVFGFDGYNEQSIKSILRRVPMSSEQTLPVFSELKSKREKAYSNYALALLHIMKSAFVRKRRKKSVPLKLQTLQGNQCDLLDVLDNELDKRFFGIEFSDGENNISAEEYIRQENSGRGKYKFLILVKSGDIYKTRLKNRVHRSIQLEISRSGDIGIITDCRYYDRQYKRNDAYITPSGLTSIRFAFSLDAILSIVNNELNCDFTDVIITGDSFGFDTTVLPICGSI